MSKKITIEHPDFIEHKLTAQFKALKIAILYDGDVVKLNRRGKFKVIDDKGQEREGDMSSNLFKPVSLRIDGGEKIQISEDLPKVLYVFMALNLLLISGGAIGGALMGINLAFDRTIFLSDKPVVLKGVFCLLLTFLSFYLLAQMQSAFH